MRQPLDDATRLKAESSYPMYYEFVRESDANAPGTASFD